MSANKSGYTPKEIESLLRRSCPWLTEQEVVGSLKHIHAMSDRDFNGWLRSVHYTLKESQ